MRVLDPEARTVTAHRPGQPPFVFAETDTLTVGDIIPGFRVAVRDVFQLLNRPQPRGCSHGGPALSHRHRPGSPRPAADADQAVLRLQHAVRPAAQLGDLPGLPRPARRAAGHEPPGVRAGPQGGAWPSTARSPRSPSGTARTTTTPTCRRTTRSASTTCRSATTAGWRSRRRPGPKQIGIIRVHLEEDAGKMLHDEQGGGQRQPRRSQPHRHAAAGDRQPAGPAQPGGGEGLPRGDAAAAARARRLRLRDAGGQPPLRRQRQPPRPAARRRRRRHADRRDQEPQQLPRPSSGP